VNEIQNNKVNLCDSCSQVYPDCTSKPEDVYFGDGIGHDNICACSEYQPSAQPEQPTGVQDILQYLDEYLHPIVSPEHWSVYSELYDMVSMLPSAEPRHYHEENLLTYAHDMGVTLEQAKKELQKVTEQPETHEERTETHDWIPVTERLPDEWKRVLIQNDEGLFLVGFVKDSGCGKEWYYQYEMYDYDAYVESEQGKIVAWCELPDPWKGEW